MNSHPTDQFLRLGYTVIPFSGVRQIRTALALFTELVIAFPFELANVSFDNEGNPTNPSNDSADLGYIRRTGSRPQDDIKTFLHYAGEKRLEQALARHNADFLEAIRLVLQSNEAIYRLCQDTIFRFATELDGFFGGNGALSSLVGQPDDKLRTLAYQAIRPGTENEIGKEHYDQSGLTLAIYQSSPGLELFIDGSWNEINVPNGMATIFAGRRLAKFSNGRIPAVKHRVRMNATQIDRLAIIRSAMVFFSNLKGVELDRSSP
jgi:hypothetical protein